MSLKAFHVLFIALSIVLSFGVAVWAIQQWAVSRATGDLTLGVVLFLVGFGLLGYGFRFIQKWKEMG